MPIEVYGHTNFVQDKTKVEKTQYMFNPIIAVAITSASRLLLAAAELILANHGESHAYCDTDSMAVPPKYSQEVQDFFSCLNPYGTKDQVFKLEEEDVWFYGISAKRYSIFRLENNQVQIGEDDYSAHGLGHLLHPFKKDVKDKSNWQIQIWQDILDNHYGQLSNIDFREKYQNHYALQSLGVSAPSIQDRFKNLNHGKEYSQQIKPRNFVLVGFSDAENPHTGKPIKPLASAQNPPRYAVYDDFVDYYDKDGTTFCGKEYWNTLWDTIEKFLNHPEDKFEGDIGTLKRKHIFVDKIVHIGKESNDLDNSEILGVTSDNYQIYENMSQFDEMFEDKTKKILELAPKQVKDFGISKQLLHQTKTKLSSDQISSISYETRKRFLTFFDAQKITVQIS